MNLKLNPPVPELPVADVEKAQKYYQDVLGFNLEWIYPGKEIGAVSNGKCTIFFRKRSKPFEPAIHWIYADDVDVTYEKLVESAANIVDDIENKPWGLRQFTIEDLDGNVFYIHHDLPSFTAGKALTNS